MKIILCMLVGNDGLFCVIKLFPYLCIMYFIFKFLFFVKIFVFILNNF
jgi:hypothetical protein